MESIKGLARRARQTLREKVTNADHTPTDERLTETTKKVHSLEKSSEIICDKLLKVAKLIEELGTLVKEIGEEYRTVPDLVQESGQLGEDMFNVGTTLTQSAQEHQKGLKDQGFDVLNGFLKDLNKLKDAEEARRKCQLEYDFFHAKVLDLRRDPPKDFTRIPRNEQILENWRVELWKATENNKAVCSTLYIQGRRAIDLSCLTVVQVLSSFIGIAASGFKQQFVNARLPVYPTTPELPPAPLPPNPLPPYQPPPQPGQAVYGAYGAPPQGGWQQPPTQGGWQQQPPPQQPGGWQQQPPQQGWPQQQQQQPPQQGWQQQQQQQPPSAGGNNGWQQPQQQWQGGWGSGVPPGAQQAPPQSQHQPQSPQPAQQPPPST